MAYQGQAGNRMRPEKGDKNLYLPITFDYSGGRSETDKMSYVWAVILAIIGLIVTIGLLTGGRGVILNIILAIISLAVFSTVIRVVLLREHEYRKDFESIDATDFERAFNDFWGIYSFEEEFPYIARFRSGKSGVFVELNKDVILGKREDAEYRHYEAIADAYKEAGASLQMAHIDYMDNIGTDDRLADSIAGLSDIKNPDLKDMMTDIFTHLQNEMDERVSNFDTYVVMWRGVDDRVAWADAQKIFEEILGANYVSYKVLNLSEVRDLTQVIMNLGSFNSLYAMSDAFGTSALAGNVISAISIRESDGSETKLGKTQEERRAEAELMARQEELRKMARKKKPKKKGKTEDEIDLF